MKIVVVMASVLDILLHVVVILIATTLEIAVVILMIPVLQVSSSMIYRHHTYLVYNLHAGVPNLPTLIQVTDLTHIRARIEWTVPLIVFTPELYTFMYSTTQDDLNTIILDPMFSGTDIAITDQLYFVLLEGLSTGTTYYYQIKIENTVGMVLTDVASFNTRMFVNLYEMHSYY